MNVYDFDNTIFIPDSSYCFVRYCARHYLRAVCTAMPASLWQLVLYLRDGRTDAQKLKEAMFSFLNRIDNVDRVVEEFWEEHFGRVEDWYLRQRRDDDLIISASPEFLLRPVAERLGVSLIATPMNPFTGKIEGRNCHDEEKVRRYQEEYADVRIENFYSDSLWDAPMARLAEKAWMVKEHALRPWPEDEEDGCRRGRKRSRR